MAYFQCNSSQGCYVEEIHFFGRNIVLEILGDVIFA